MNPLKFILTFLLFFFLHFSILAQYSFPENGLVFDDSEVPRVDILIDDASLQEILAWENLQNNEEYPATFIFTTSTSKDTVENIGFRLRGNTSRTAAKKSFKVSFNSFIKGQKFEGLEKLNLNGEHNDPSIIRSKLCWDLFRWAGVPGARSNHVALYINNEYRGLYINVEHIDEEFVQKRFSNDSGNLYKCLYPADLQYKGDNPDVYKEVIYDRRAYDLKTNTEQNDYSDLATFIKAISFNSGSAFECELERVFDVDNYLKVLAIDILTSNWDGQLNKNNFYLYNNPCTGKFTFIPYDLDNTLGIDWFGVDWPNTTLYNWYSYTWDDRPLMEKVLARPEYRNRFSFYMREIIDNYFNPDYLNPYLSEKKNLIASFRDDDTYAEEDYGWNFVDFLNSYENALGEHVKYGLEEYIGQRVVSANNLLTAYNVAPTVQHLAIDWSPQEVIFNIQTQDDGFVNEAIFHYQVGTNDWQEEVLQLNADGSTVFTLNTNETALLTYYISLTDDEGKQKDHPLCQDATLQLGYLPSPDLVINEFMASNSQTQSDEFGEYEDWIEIYNASNNPIPMRGLYLSDDADEADKWQLPFYTLYPGEYLIVWADNDTEQGDYHSNFRLDKDGEFLGLFDSKHNNLAPIDTLTFSAIDTDESYARMPNGSGDFELTTSPTFGINNNPVNTEQVLVDTKFLVYPNPTNSILNIRGEENKSFDLEVLDARGNLVFKQKNKNQIQLSSLPKGVYFLKIEGNWMKRFVKL